MGGHNSGRRKEMSRIFDSPNANIQFSEGQKSKGILDDYTERLNINTKEGTIQKTPANAKDIANKAYVDSQSGGAPEGTAVLSTGEVGGTKFLREDGDGTRPWQPDNDTTHQTALSNIGTNTHSEIDTSIPATELNTNNRK